MDRLYLSRLNIETLLNKLDSVRDGQSCSCTIIKNDHAHPAYPQTQPRVAVTAVETGDRYFRAVSQRLTVSRATLVLLLERLGRQDDSGVEIEDMLVSAVPDEKYYAERAAENATAVGHILLSLVKKWR